MKIFENNLMMDFNMLKTRNNYDNAIISIYTKNKNRNNQI